VRSSHRSLPFFFQPTSATGTKSCVFPRASCRYVYSLFGIISRQRRPWGGKTTGKRAGIDDYGDPLWASLIQNRVRDNTAICLIMADGTRTTMQSALLLIGPESVSGRMDGCGVSVLHSSFCRIGQNCAEGNAYNDISRKAREGGAVDVVIQTHRCPSPSLAQSPQHSAQHVMGWD